MRRFGCAAVRDRALDGSCGIRHAKWLYDESCEMLLICTGCTWLLRAVVRCPAQSCAGECDEVSQMIWPTCTHIKKQLAAGSNRRQCNKRRKSSVASSNSDTQPEH